MKKPPPKEESKVVEPEKNLSSKSEVIPTKSNNSALKSLDTITEEDENMRESIKESPKQQISSQSQIVQKPQPVATKVPAFLNQPKPADQMRRQSTLDSMNDALKSRLLAMQTNGKKKVVKKKGRNSDSDDNESSDDDSDESN